NYLPHHRQATVAKACLLGTRLLVGVLAVILGGTLATPAWSLPSGSVVHEETKTGGSSNSTTVTTSASVTAVNGNLYLVAISTQPKVSVLSVSGLGLNWTFVRAKCSGRNSTGIEVWMARGTPSDSGAVTATLAQAPGAAVIAVSRYSGAANTNPIGNVITGNTTGINVSAVCSGGVDNSAYSFNINTTRENAVVYGAVAMKELTHTPGAGYIERDEITQMNGIKVSSVAVEDTTVASPASVPVNGSFSGVVDWAVVALEIKPQPIIEYKLTVNTVGAGNVAFDPPGGVYHAGTVVTLIPQSGTDHQFIGWSEALGGSANPATITMSGNKNVTATFKANTPANGPIIYQGTRIGGASNSTTVTTFASVNAANGHLYLAAISTQPKASVLSVSGLGLNWTFVRAKCSGRNTTGIEVWMAQGAPSGSGNVTATFAKATGAAVIAVSRYSGTADVNPIGSMIAGNTTGMNANALCSGGVDNSAYSFNLNTSVDSAVVYGVVAMKGLAHTPDTSFTERAEVARVNGINASSLAVEDKASTSAGSVAVNGSLSGNVDWVLLALEIKPKPPKTYTLAVNTIGSGSVALDPPGGIYNAGTVVTLTPQSGAGFQFSGWSGALSGSANPATIAMNSDKSVTATFEKNGPIVHEETKTGESSGSTTVATSASVTAVNGDLYLAAISTQPKVSVLSISGLGLNWTFVRAKCSGRNSTGIEVWMARGTPSGSGNVAAIFANATGAAVIAVSRYSGVAEVNPIGDVIGGNTMGINANAVCSGGVDNNA
ncbi:MAG: InlB B-repeat-containing protein, partial [bacterium]